VHLRAIRQHRKTSRSAAQVDMTAGLREPSTTPALPSGMIGTDMKK